MRALKIAGLGLAAMTGLCATAAEASLSLQIYNSIENSSRFAPSNNGGPLSLDHNLATPFGSYAGSGFVDYGVIKAFVTANGDQSDIRAETGGFWRDRITLTTPGVSSGFMTAAMMLDAELLFGNSGLSQNNLDFRFFASTATSGTAYSYQYNLSTSLFASFPLTSTLFINDNGASSTVSGVSPSPLMLQLQFAIPFTSGAAFDIQTSLSCSTRGVLTFSTCDAGYSAYWGGIRSVTDSNGAALTNWTLTSGSGTDWTQSFIPGSGAVPEPDSWAMLIAGFGLVGAVSRRRRAVPARAGSPTTN
jgi:hypothetical protein